MKINNQNSSAKFSIKKLWFLTVNGILPEIIGEVVLDEKEISASTIALKIPLKGIDTQNAKRNEHLLQEDFFNAKKFPEITFKSNDVSMQGKQFLAKGELSMAGVSKRVEIPFSYSEGKAVGSFTLNRMDYKVGKIPAFVAANNVQIEFECLLK